MTGSESEAARAEAAFRELIAREPESAAARQGLGKALLDQLRLAEAEEAFREAIPLESVPQLAEYHPGLCRLLQGDYAEGWKGWEKRLLVPAFGHKHIPLPRWEGGAPPGRKLLCLAEQGYGDTIQFARFLPRAAREHGLEITFLCPERLLALYAGWGGGVGAAASIGRLGEFDGCFAVASLGAILGVRLEELPGELPPLQVEQEKVARWHAARPKAKRAIGVNWEGRHTHPQDAQRSLPPEMLLPLKELADTALVGLQMHPWKRRPPAGLLDADWGGEIRDFSDTAAMVRSLDAVVTVDTSLAHLAGTLGVPTFVLLPYAPDWRWLLGREDSPWYPSMRLVRQERPGEWSAVTEQMVAWLR